MYINVVFGRPVHYAGIEACDVDVQERRKEIQQNKEQVLGDVFAGDLDDCCEVNGASSHPSRGEHSHEHLVRVVLPGEAMP